MNIVLFYYFVLAYTPCVPYKIWSLVFGFTGHLCLDLQFELHISKEKKVCLQKS